MNALNDNQQATRREGGGGPGLRYQDNALNNSIEWFE